VVIFEKSRGLSGRAATRWHNLPAGRAYIDHGAQYLKHDKPGHLPVGYSALVVQMGAAYSLEQDERDKEDNLKEIAALTLALLGVDLTTPDFSDLQQWRYAIPDVLVTPESVNGVLPGLWFAGDSLRGGAFTKRR